MVFCLMALTRSTDITTKWVLSANAFKRRALLCETLVQAGSAHDKGDNCHGADRSSTDRPVHAMSSVSLC